MADPSVTGDWSPEPVAGWPAVPGYEILAELGRGGMGVVYKARQTGDGRLVALKLIRDGALAGPQERARFRIEAEAAARIRHPNVVRVFEVGESQGLPYFAMEFVEGGSLARHLGGRPQPARPAAELVRTLAMAVQQAHDQRIIHRDLKPANILWAAPAASDAPGTPVIVDFGLAKRLDSDSTAWTQDGAVLGTASYMAPEQAAGHVADIGPAVDVYALGAILYELLTGRPPFRGESWGQTIEQVLRDDPTPPTRSRPDVPADLEAVCLKCLEKEPARRYATAKDLADDLSRFLADTRVTAAPPAERDRLARLAARDGYEIVDEIGRGPRSVVYRAVSGPLRQTVALKVFAVGCCPEDAWNDRLQRASARWSVLAHPQVVVPTRAGWWDGRPYIAVEFAPHGSLAARLTGRPLPLREALRLVGQLAEVICYLHRQGVVHGNLKPGNVLFAADGIPRVTDLHPSGGHANGPLPTDDADPAGLGYVPPELVENPSAEPRLHADIYGLGAILYELLTGRPAAAGETAGAVQERLRSLDPVPPSSLNSDVTPELEAFCLRCLRRNPWWRFQRAYDVLARLRQFQDAATGRADRGSPRQ